MDIRKIKLLLNTVKYLKPIQVFYRLYYFLRNSILSIEVSEKTVSIIDEIKWSNKLNTSLSYTNETNSFIFLNISHSFSGEIDWNYAEYGKLWAYNLNYFDFLIQKEMPREIGIKLIDDYIRNDNILKDGKEPYPISLRGINWVKFLAKNSIRDALIDKTLYHHYRTLLRNLEYHLLGNHLLENAFSLLFGAYYFRDEKLYAKSKKLLISELNEQILNDGAHFELSPMYHKIILSRLLDCIQLIKLNNVWKKDDLLLLMVVKAGLMNSWLKKITYKNGDIPMINDATFNIAPSTRELFNYGKQLGINTQDIPLSDSGYRKINYDNYELLIDVGNVGPHYQPGHAHSDTFNFELIKEGKPIIVDVGTSTYEKNSRRQEERSTSSHNTVKIGDKEQTQVWGGFRVAKRAKITHLVEKPNLIEASHDGYLSDGYKHTRSFFWKKNNFILTDKINRSTSNSARAYFHLHFSITKPLVDGNTIILESSGVSFEFENASNINIDEYQLSAGFNKTNLAYRIVVLFDQTLKTKISL
jgi:hypothetical protein